MFRDAAERPVAPTLAQGKSGPRSRRGELVPSLWLRGRLARLAPAARRWGSTSTSGSAWRSPWRPAGRRRGWGCGSWSGWPAYGLRRGGFELDRALVASKLRPLAFQLGLWCLYHQLRLLDLPSAVVGVTIPAVKVVWIGLMGWTAIRLIDLGMILYARSERLHDRRSLSDMIVPTAANGLKLAALVVAASFQVYLIGSRETLTQLLAGLGLVGLAASLAAQDTLKNFFGTLLLIGEHPFRIGEHVAVQGVEGTVESVGFRSTRLRTFEDSLLTIPNSVMAAALIDNRAARACRRFRTVVSLAYGTPIDKLVAHARRPAGVRGGPSPVPARTRSRSTSATWARAAWSCSCRSTSGWRTSPTRWPAATSSAARSSGRPRRLGVELRLPAADDPRRLVPAGSAPVPPRPKHLAPARRRGSEAQARLPRGPRSAISIPLESRLQWPASFPGPVDEGPAPQGKNRPGAQLPGRRKKRRVAASAQSHRSTEHWRRRAGLADRCHPGR